MFGLATDSTANLTENINPGSFLRAAPFVILQLIMPGLTAAFPEIESGQALPRIFTFGEKYCRIKP